MATKKNAPAADNDAPEAVAEAMEANGDPNFMTSLARGLAVIRAFSADERGMTVLRISQKIGLPRTAVRRCLHTLQCLGYVHSEGSVYSLRPRVLSLGHMYLASTPLSVTAQPVLERVARELKETTSLAVLDQGEVLFIGHSSQVQLVSVSFAVGSRLPAHCTANGHVLLGGLSRDALHAYFAAAHLKRMTPKTVTSRKELLQRIAKAREDGYGLVDQEYNMAVRSIAVPVRGVDGNIVASLSVSAPAARFSVTQLRNAFLRPLTEAAAELH
jgi:IclR family pca regulon transcriptional regulator